MHIYIYIYIHIHIYIYIYITVCLFKAASPLLAFLAGAGSCGLARDRPPTIEEASIYYYHFYYYYGLFIL